MARLIVTERGKKREIVLAALTTIGRNQDSTIELLDGQASRNHCEIHVDGERFLLRDCSSRNGTFVNGKRITECELLSGDEFMVGKAVLRVEAAAYGMDVETTSINAQAAFEDGVTGPVELADLGPVDDATLLHRLDDGYTRLTARVKELNGLLQVMTSSSSATEERVRTIDETAARVSETVLHQERVIRELWAQCTRLGQLAENQEQRIQALARELAKIHERISAGEGTTSGDAPGGGGGQTRRSHNETIPAV